MNGSMATLALLAAVALNGCATEQTAAPQAEKRADGVVCSQERPIGSNIAVTRCRTPEQAERERSAATETLGSPSRGANGSTYKPGS
jgi:hypothetical protein